MHKQNVVNTHSVILFRKEILPPATAWMNLEGITVRDTSQSQRDKYSLIALTQSRQTHRDRVAWWLPGVGERREGEAVQSFSFAIQKCSGGPLHNNVNEP